MKRFMCIVLAAGMLLSSSSVQAETYSEVVKSGEYGQVSTIVGNGSLGQGAYTLDHPRFPASDSKGNVYFLDGSQKTAKLRMYNGKQNKTIVDLRKNVVTSREGEFFSTGLQVINDTVYFSSEEKVYKLIGSRVTELDQGIASYMKQEHYGYVYRMEQYQGDLILMLWRKGDRSTEQLEYGFIRYHLDTQEIEEILPATWFAHPTNFFMQDMGIAVTAESGFIYYARFFPRINKILLNTNEGRILDTWMTEDFTYHVINRNRIGFAIYRIPLDYVGEGIGELVAGGGQGFTDGIADEVRMDYPTDFTWDGTGYLFADRDNHAIRKLWIDKKPL